MYCFRVVIGTRRRCPSLLSHVRWSSHLTSPLNGIRVVDLTRILAGPFCAMMLGDLGADVIKIERPGIGDDTRHWGPPFYKDESCYFLSVNRNKKSLAVNLKHPKGVEVIKKLVATSDVLLENYVPGTLDELGIGYDALKKVNPSLIFCSISGYGQTGPYSTRGGYDVIAAAIGGLLNITGPGDGDPVKPGVALTDLATGLCAKSAIMAALLQRYRTGEGQRIDTNLLSTQVALLTSMAANYLLVGQEGRRRGTEHESIVPYQAFKTIDGYLVIGAGNDTHFQTLCKIIDLPDVAKDKRFHGNSERVRHRDILIPILSERLSQKKNSDWLELLEGCGFPYGPINNMGQVFSDPQVLHNGMVQEIQHPTVGDIRVPGHPIKYSSITTDVRLAPPLLGQHTADILTNVLGYSQDEVQTLHREKAVDIPS